MRAAVILSTCNRVEFLVRGPTTEGGAAIDRYLASDYDLDRTVLDRHVYRMTGRDAIRHLFRVTAGLDSMILGEPQVLGQVKQSYLRAKGRGVLGTVLERLCQHSLAAACGARR